MSYIKLPIKQEPSRSKSQPVLENKIITFLIQWLARYNQTLKERLNLFPISLIIPSKTQFLTFPSILIFKIQLFAFGYVVTNKKCTYTHPTSPLLIDTHTHTLHFTLTDRYTNTPLHPYRQTDRHTHTSSCSNCKCILQFCEYFCHSFVLQPNLYAVQKKFFPIN